MVDRWTRLFRRPIFTDYVSTFKKPGMRNNQYMAL
jgi:hypothetical protein